MPHAVRRIASTMLAVALAVAGFVSATTADAVQRTFVHSSPTGNDANAALSPPCTQAAPCRTFAVAIGVTDPAGEIVALDTAGYGAVTITKSIKILAPGVYGGITVGGATGTTTGIVINAADTDVVTLRGLDISGLTTAPLPIYGIDIQNAGAVHIEKTTIGNFTQGASACIYIVDAKPVQVYVNDSFLRECRDGIYANGTGATDTERLTLVVDNTRIEHMVNTGGGGTNAIRLIDAILATVRNSVIAWSGDGVNASNANTAVVARHHIVSTQFTRMGNGALQTSGAPGASLHVNMENSAITSSFAGLLHGHGQAIFTANVIASNANSLVDCSGGGAAVQSLGYGAGNGSNAIYFNSDSVLPPGCTAWFTPVQFTGK